MYTCMTWDLEIHERIFSYVRMDKRVLKCKESTKPINKYLNRPISGFLAAQCLFYKMDECIAER